MLAFRSEEHLESWRGSIGLARGGLLTPGQQWQLAAAWYANRLAPDWRRRTPDEAEALFAQVGLEGDFWRLRP